MSGDSKPSEADYFEQHGADLGFPVPLDAGKKVYEFNMAAAMLQINTVVGELIQFLGTLAASYADGRPELLYYPMKPADLQVMVKPFESMLTKVYRINCLQNRNYPAEPKQGFVNQANIYDHVKMNDLLRARLVCKYMDGPQFVASKLAEFCSDKDYEFRSYPMNNEMGYYAWHCYIRSNVEIMNNQVVEDRAMWFELQITTQLAEVITSLTHGLYEGNRTQSPRSIGDAWRWEPRSQQFRSAYLGHTLHLLEGVIQTFRDEVLGLDAAEPPVEQAEGDVAEATEEVEYLEAPATPNVPVANETTGTVKNEEE